MDLGIAGRVAMVGGASSGLGLAVATHLATNGVDVSMAARRPDALEAAVRSVEAAGPGRVLGVATDVTDESALTAWVTATVDAFGGVQIVVINSGGPPYGDALAFGVDDYRRAVESNLLSSIALVQQTLPHLRAAGWGRILFIASTSVKEPIPGLALSNVARAGLAAYAKSLIRPLAGTGITVNVLAPGIHATPRIGLDPASLERAGAGIPAGRVGRPEDFGAVAAFLASEPAGFVNGTVIAVDGGASHGLL